MTEHGDDVYMGCSAGRLLRELCRGNGKKCSFFKKKIIWERERGKRSNPFEAHSFMRALSLGTIHQRWLEPLRALQNYYKHKVSGFIIKLEWPLKLQRRRMTWILPVTVWSIYYRKIWFLSLVNSLVLTWGHGLDYSFHWWYDRLDVNILLLLTLGIHKPSDRWELKKQQPGSFHSGSIFLIP